MKTETVVITNNELLQAWEVLDYLVKKTRCIDCRTAQRTIEDEMCARDFLKDKDLMNSVRKKFVDELS